MGLGASWDHRVPHAGGRHRRDQWRPLVRRKVRRWLCHVLCVPTTKSRVQAAAEATLRVLSLAFSRAQTSPLAERPAERYYRPRAPHEVHTMSEVGMRSPSARCTDREMELA